MQRLLKRPKVSVVLTSYNHAKFLPQSIESVLNQTYQDYELIIVDDASTDESWSIINSYEDERIKKIRHSFNFGHGVLWDTIQRYTNGQYIAVHHSDDIWEKTKLEKQVVFLTNHKEYACVFTGVNVICEDGTTYTNENGFYYNAFKTINMSRQEWIKYLIEKGNCLCHPSVLIRKKVYYKIKPFGEGLRQIPDLLVWIRICMNYSIYVIPEKLVSFRVHDQGENTSGFRSDTQVRSSIESMLILQELLKIKSKEEFQAIFPQAKIVGNSKYDIACSLSLLLLEDQTPEYAKLFSLQVLYWLLNNKKGRKILLNNYHLSSKEYFNLTGKYDIFKILRSYCNQEVSLYEMIEKDKWRIIDKKKFLFQDKDYLNLLFDISKVSTEVKYLRFDPCEYLYIKVNLYKCRINGTETNMYGFSHHAVLDDALIFLTKDPIFIIDYMPGNYLEIELELERLA